jgi:hypothetical protein
MYRRLVASLLSKSALFVHVSPSYQLDAYIEAKLFRGCNFKRHHFNHALQVLLVAIHYDDLISAIKAVGQLVSD